MVFRARARGDEGFVLLESIVSISLITVIMTALTSLFVTVIRVDNEQRSRQVAVQVADSTASYVRSLPASDLLPGRIAAAVTDQWTSASADVQPYLTAMEPAVAGGVAVLPLTLPTQVVHGVSYTVNVYLGWCHTAAGGAASTACAKPVAPVTHDRLRAVIGVAWGDRHCGPLNAGDPTPTCVYVSATLISTFGDPVFNLNQPALPLPVIKLPSFTGIAVGDAVSLQMDVAPSTGVPLLTWALTGGTWPPGVSMDGTGFVSGTITAQGPMPPLTVTVTDGFARKVAVTFPWTVLPALKGTIPADRGDVLGAPIPTLTISATGGAGSPYTWSDPTSSLPPGLSLSAAGVVTGTPNAVAPAYPATYAVLLTLADASITRKATVGFVWTIRYAPLVVTNPGARTDSAGHVIAALQLTATGGKGPYSWTVTGLPAGLSTTSTGSITGTVTGTAPFPRVSTVTVTATDQQGTLASATFTWTVVAGPTITSPGNQSSQVGKSVSLRPAGNICPHGPCTYSATGLPTGLSIDVLTGTIAGTPTVVRTFTNITVTVTDVDGVFMTSGKFSWVAQPYDLFSQVSSPVKIPLASMCPATPCSYLLNNGPPGVNIDNTGLMRTAPGTGTVGGLPTTYTVTITVKDANSVTTTSAPFKWTVGAQGVISATWPVFTSPGDTPDQPLFYKCSPQGNQACRISVAGQPLGVGLSKFENDLAAKDVPSLTVSNGSSGILWLSGTVDGTTPPGTTTVILTITAERASNSGNDSGDWTVR